MKNRFGLFFVAAMLLAGCAGVTTPPTPTSASAPTPAPPGMLPPQPEQGVIVEPKPVMSNNQAVIALLDRAQLDSQAGQREAAGAALERALRIEPRNPWLWLELAQVRLVQGQYAQAITLARKSNSFSGGQPRVQAKNWQVIGQARAAQGDSAGAEQAFKLAAELAKQANAELDRGSGPNF